MKADAVFLDSGIFIAFLDRSDRFHPAAVELFSKPPRRCHTSLAVVSETYGWFLHRLGEEAARTFRLALVDFPWLTLHALDTAHHTAVLKSSNASRPQADVRGCLGTRLPLPTADSRGLGHR